MYPEQSTIPLIWRVLQYVANNPTVTGIEVARHFRLGDSTYGHQKPTSQAIASLRAKSYLEDCARCEHCHRALTRAHRNVPLNVTDEGLLKLKELGL